MAFDFFKVKYDFGDAVAEAKACRTTCALFDFSFLECARLEGQGAERVIEGFTGRSLQSLAQDQIFYALHVDGMGRALSDLTIWRIGAQSFELMSGCRQDIVDLLAHDGADARVTDLTASRAVFSVQGPGALDALARCGDRGRLARLEYFKFDRIDLCGIPCTVGRLGYTGEAGFEIVVKAKGAAELWSAVSTCATPAGFIAADMLRIEAGFVLYTHEFCLPVSPAEAGLGKFHPLNVWNEPRLRLASFRADAQGLSWPWQAASPPARPPSSSVIAVTSACCSMIAGGILGLGYVIDEERADRPIQDPSGTFRNVRLVPRPFYDSTKSRPRALWREPPPIPDDLRYS
jgi:aminomethyltransferase